jgi:hypothetical protein
MCDVMAATLILSSQIINDHSRVTTPHNVGVGSEISVPIEFKLHSSMPIDRQTELSKTDFLAPQ